MQVNPVIDKIRYGTKEIIKNGNDRIWWRKRFLSRVFGPAYSKMLADDGLDFMTEDWDNLMILDACRADMFEEVFDTDEMFDSYERVNSVGASSPEWIRRTFKNKEYSDTVYASGNPWVSKIAPDSFHELRNLWIQESSAKEDELEDFKKFEETSVEKGSTIYPEDLNSCATDLHNNNPNKRMIVHYFQPHYPIISDNCGQRIKPPKDLKPDHIRTKEDVSRSQLWNQYKNNLRYVFQRAEKLAKDLGGKTVFTADHGEMFGNNPNLPIKIYGHIENLRVNELTEVPWAIRNHGERREIKDGHVSDHEFNSEEIEKRLEDLGYK